jgi:hypothetical protein
MSMAKGFKVGELVRHIYSGDVGILLKLRPIDIVEEPGNPHTIYDAYVYWNGDELRWVPLEHIKKI